MKASKPQPNLVLRREIPSKKNVDVMIEQIIPKICPPSSNEPLDMAYPTGKAVSLAKSVIVVR